MAIGVSVSAILACRLASASERLASLASAIADAASERLARRISAKVGKAAIADLENTNMPDN